jgi:RNA polymerase sigma factor (sigma-70 family)
MDLRLFALPTLRPLRNLLAPVRRWSAGDVALSPAERYRRETELEEAIRTLPAELRMVFELSYWHDLVQTEIAEVLGVSVGTVAARFSLARAELSHLLRD